MNILAQIKTYLGEDVIRTRNEFEESQMVNSKQRMKNLQHLLQKKIQKNERIREVFEYEMEIMEENEHEKRLNELRKMRHIIKQVFDEE
jgi:predicted transcriptional regulator